MIDVTVCAENKYRCIPRPIGCLRATVCCCRVGQWLSPHLSAAIDNNLLRAHQILVLPHYTLSLVWFIPFFSWQHIRAVSRLCLLVLAATSDQTKWPQATCVFFSEGWREKSFFFSFHYYYSFSGSFSFFSFEKVPIMCDVMIPFSSARSQHRRTHSTTQHTHGAHSFRFDIFFFNNIFFWRV